jgi:hypothetical protein
MMTSDDKRRMQAAWVLEEVWSIQHGYYIMNNPAAKLAKGS